MREGNGECAVVSFPLRWAVVGVVAMFCSVLAQGCSGVVQPEASLVLVKSVSGGPPGCSHILLSTLVTCCLIHVVLGRAVDVGLTELALTFVDALLRDCASDRFPGVGHDQVDLIHFDMWSLISSHHIQGVPLIPLLR